jgi:uncharacterized protein (DUF2384 family)
MSLNQPLRHENRGANLRYIAELANNMLGPPRAAAWLCQGQEELEGRSPIDDLETEEGLRRVEALLFKQAVGSAL